ncbi:MAG: hypothetical protein ACLUSM_11270 [Enterococcus avium]|uniref:hypothetical protein n=1 Tax=Enterococcus faecalis TaxID=1351 RepID=UPI002090C5E2|nr:hypothetical protein [Enterococcus faecalis]MCO5404448.1 hypothetical protein [Enterococcus faecalis]
MLNKKNIMGIIQDIKDRIEVIESELRRADDLNLDIPELTMDVRNELSCLYEDKERYELQAKVWGLIEEETNV